MNRIIPISLLIFWAMQFALQLIAAIKGMPLVLFSPFDLHDPSAQWIDGEKAAPVLAIVSGLIAALFVWATMSVAAASGKNGEDGSEPVRIAFSAAILTVTIFSFIGAMRGVFVPFAPIAVLLVALAISWQTVMRELGTAEKVDDEEGEESQHVASRMAGEAAHKAMLGALTGRPPRNAG